LPDVAVLDRVPSFSDVRTLRTRSRNATVHTANTLTRAKNHRARKADPIKALLRERKKEAHTGGGIDAQNCAEGYDHTALLSDFSVDEVDEPADDNTGRSNMMDENVICRADANGPQGGDAKVTASTLEEVHKEERERLLGAKEGEAVGRILDADRKLGQTVTHSVLGVVVFNDDYKGTVDTDTGGTPCHVWESAEGKTKTLQLLSDAIGQQGK